MSRAFYNLLLLGRRPKPALLFSLQKSKQKASTPGSHKIYFYPGILQLPTVGQVKCLYNSVKNKFYRRLQRGALNSKRHSKSERQQQGLAPGLLLLGRHPKPALLFFIAKKTLRAAPCRPHPAGGLCKKLAPRAAVRRTNLFLSGHFTTFFSGVAPLTRLTFFIAKK